MTWIGIPGGIYIKPLSDTAFYVIRPDGMVNFILVKHTTGSSDADVIGTYPDPHTAMYAAQKKERDGAS